MSFDFKTVRAQRVYMVDPAGNRMEVLHRRGCHFEAMLKVPKEPTMEVTTEMVKVFWDAYHEGDNTLGFSYTQTAIALEELFKHMAEGGS